MNMWNLIYSNQDLHLDSMMPVLHNFTKEYKSYNSCGDIK
jgi:hypothetical protein